MLAGMHMFWARTRTHLKWPGIVENSNGKRKGLQNSDSCIHKK